MKVAVRIMLGILLLSVVALVALDDGAQPSTGRRAPAGNLAASAASAPAMMVSEPVLPAVSPAVRDLTPAVVELTLERELERHNPFKLSSDLFVEDDAGPDPLWRPDLRAPGSSPAPILSFEGISAPGSWTPPDPIGDVGPNHYVQAVNMSFQIWDKAGNSLAGPHTISSLWTGQANACETSGYGDPVVLYDSLADRWLISQFVGSGNDLCVAISQSADPTGSYWLYRFPLAEFPDYYKFGVWPDAYHMSANESSYTAYAFDRGAMVAGAGAGSVRFSGGTNFFLPADLDGLEPPPAGSPGLFYTFKDATYHGGGVDRLEVYALAVNWATPGSASFTLHSTIPVASFNYTVCGFFQFNCIPQNNTSNKVDAVSEWPMWRLQYRNFGTHETLVGNFSVDVTGSDQAGIRWFELRRVGPNPWALFQEGTHAPDTNHRWMGSIAMDGDGNIALGYSVSSSTLFPTIRYATRLASDPVGTMQAEPALPAGTGSQLVSNRWGDYSSLNVDPADDCTFWYTNEFYPTTSTNAWHTRILTFKVPGCGLGGNKVYLPLLQVN